MDDQNQSSDPRDVITETYEDLDMAEIVDFDRYEEMIYDDLEEREREMVCEIIDGYEDDEYEEYMLGLEDE
jgi:hypothetical protein